MEALENKYEGGKTMIIAIWIIAICEVIRAAQNMVSILMSIKNDRYFKKQFAERDDFFNELANEIRQDEEDNGYAD